MTELFESVFGGGMGAQYAEAAWVTVYVTLLGTIISYIIGIPIGVLLYITDKGGIAPNPVLNKVIGVIVNILRSVPFVILLVMTQPIAKLIVGSKIGNAAFIVYLTIAAAPFVSRRR